MRELAKYSFANAKIRAMLSCLIKSDMFSKLMDAKDIYEVIDGLKGTVYYDILSKYPAQIKDLKIIEKEILKNDIDAYYKVYDAISSKNERDFVFILTERYEIEQLKAILRIWHKKAQVDIGEYLIGKAICHDIDFHKIAAAQNIEEIILLLDHTPYKKPLMEARDKFKEKGSVFYLEVSLDTDYYKRLGLCVDRFSAMDRKIAKKILGIEIDIENINWLVRLKKYYSFGVGDILPLLISGGDRIQKDNIINLYMSNGVSSVVESIAVGPYAQIKRLINENVGLIENFLCEILMKEIKRALAGFPFTIGILLGYLILKRSETRNVISLLYAKSYGWKKEEVEHLLKIC
jgi:V/A-type H+-transporting ATPase subunit C